MTCRRMAGSGRSGSSARSAQQCAHVLPPLIDVRAILPVGSASRRVANASSACWAWSAKFVFTPDPAEECPVDACRYASSLRTRRDGMQIRSISPGSNFVNPPAYVRPATTRTLARSQAVSARIVCSDMTSRG